MVLTYTVQSPALSTKKLFLTAFLAFLQTLLLFFIPLSFCVVPLAYAVPFPCRS